MKLEKLLQGVNVLAIKGSILLDIKSVEIDSRNITKQSLYVCVKGDNFDGHDFVFDAIKNGANCIVTEKVLDIKVTQIIVSDSRKATSVIAKNFYNSACDKLRIIGVTGTNGKTSTTHFIKRILDKSGYKVGVIGTLGVYYNDVKLEPTLTTPDPIKLHEIFYKMVEAKIDVVVMEVSAHALYYDKLLGINFEIGVFTNFTQDHLDFFGSMENYKSAKLKFFKENNFKYAVVNSDDEVGISLLNSCKNTVSYGLNNPSDVFAIKVKQEKDGTSFVINLFDCIYDVKNQLIGTFNVYNLLASATVCALVGVETDLIGGSLNSMDIVVGRMEKVYSDKFDVYVDYAHTPDGLEKALNSLRKVTKKRLVSVFGCGGNRDLSKRAVMGKISAKIADFTVITSDNPRFEDPMSIIGDIEKGFLEVSKNYVVIEKRKEGIKYALDFAKEGDVVLIAGKGSENYQEILSIKHPHNDKDTVKEIIGEKL